jgi:hypothetical protein
LQFKNTAPKPEKKKEDDPTVNNEYFKKSKEVKEGKKRERTC